MKRIGLVAALAVLSAAPVPVLAQGEKPAAAPATEMKMEAKTGQQAAKPAAGARAPSRATQDARSCLEFPTNREIIICAEKFR